MEITEETFTAAVRRHRVAIAVAAVLLVLFFGFLWDLVFRVRGLVGAHLGTIVLTAAVFALLSRPGRDLLRRHRVRIVAVVAVAAVLAAAASAHRGFTSTGGGEIAVVRDGGPFDDNRVRAVLDPSSEWTWVGVGSQVHRYPAQQRFYTITTDPKRATALGVDTLVISSNDGVNLGVEGTLYFTLNRDHRVLRAFDDRYGTRLFRGQDDAMLYPWEGDAGWAAFFGQAIRPVIDNSLRSQISGFRCADLVPSCAFMQQDPAKPRVLITNKDGKANFAKIQDAVNGTLTSEIEATLGAPFLTGFRFALTRITLPAPVQQAVDEGQAAMARLYKAQADVRQARAKAAADKARQEGYRACPVCAEIDKRNGRY